MNIVIDVIVPQPDGSKVVYLQFLDDNNLVIDTTSVAYTDDQDAFVADIQTKFQSAVTKSLDLRDVRATVQKHIDALDISGATLDPITKQISFPVKAVKL